MPEIARFYGMIVKMFFRNSEHNPPHIHIIYSENVGLLELATGEMIEGDLPPRALRLANEWLTTHRNELQAMWQTQQLTKLPPLE